MVDHVFLYQLMLVKSMKEEEEEEEVVGLVDHKLNIAMIHLEWLLDQHNKYDNHDHIDHRTSY
jgi:hypothetical protein